MRTSILLVMLACGPVVSAEPAKPAPSPVAETLETWNEAGRKLVAMAEDFPEAKYDYKPSPEMRSFAEQLLHAAGGNVLFLDLVQGKTPKEADPPRAQYETKAKVVAFLKKSIADDAAYISKTGDAGMLQAIKSPPWAQRKTMTPIAFWLDAAGHMGEHYGQLVVYYRLNKLVPPESRPKTK